VAIPTNLPNFFLYIYLQRPATVRRQFSVATVAGRGSSACSPRWGGPPRPAAALEQIDSEHSVLDTIVHGHLSEAECTRRRFGRHQ